MAGRPHRRARRNALPGYGLPTALPTKKTYAQLLTELRWLGPAVVASLILGGGTRQCQNSSAGVAFYLQERGFITRNGRGDGAGKYCGHFDLAVYTSDRGWVSVDPTAIQFHAPVNESHAIDIGLKDLNIDEDSLTNKQADRLIELYLEPTIQWAVAGILDGVQAFEVGLAPHLTQTPLESSTYQATSEWFIINPTWKEYWEYMHRNVTRLKSGKLGSFLRGYWAEEVSRRLSGHEPQFAPRWQ
jgi:hypothetical protein